LNRHHRWTFSELNSLLALLSQLAKHLRIRVWSSRSLVSCLSLAGLGFRALARSLSLSLSLSGLEFGGRSLPLSGLRFRAPPPHPLSLSLSLSLYPQLYYCRWQKLSGNNKILTPPCRVLCKSWKTYPIACSFKTRRRDTVKAQRRRVQFLFTRQTRENAANDDDGTDNVPACAPSSSAAHEDVGVDESSFVFLSNSESCGRCSQQDIVVCCSWLISSLNQQQEIGEE
jgi:hypothetical protein